MSGLRPPGKRAKEKEATFGLNKKKGEEYNRRKKERKKERSGLRPHIKKTFFWKKESFTKKTSTSGPSGRWAGG